MTDPVILPVPEGGDAACWLHRVCTECGALSEKPGRDCPRCGARLPEPEE